jgi:hypothetical protein
VGGVRDAGSEMSSKKFVIRFKPQGLEPQIVVADRVEFHGDHIVFLTKEGQLSAMFVMDVVESWSDVSETTGAA